MKKKISAPSFVFSLLEFFFFVNIPPVVNSGKLIGEKKKDPGFLPRVVPLVSFIFQREALLLCSSGFFGGSKGGLSRQVGKSKQSKKSWKNVWPFFFSDTR